LKNEATFFKAKEGVGKKIIDKTVSDRSSVVNALKAITLTQSCIKIIALFIIQAKTF
jgi:hypothetical protein